jgi:argininosuccinate synthase
VRVAVAYSGGLDTTVLCRWLKENYGAEVITVTVDVGQPTDFRVIEERAYAAGASKHYHVDARDRFVEEFVARDILFNGLYEGEYPLSTALSRYPIAEEVARIVIKERCDAVAHGCTGKGNDQLRMDASFSYFLPEDVKIMAPVREQNWSRDWEIDYALKCGLPIEVKESRFSIDENIWGRSVEGAELEDPWTGPPWEAFKWVRPPSEWPDKPDAVVIRFESGLPAALDGKRMSLREIIGELNVRLGRYGYGLIDHIEDRVIGLKSREVYEAPAALALIKCHQDLEKMVLPARCLRFKALVDREWTDLVYAGLWYHPLREALDGFVDELEKNVSGEVRLTLEKGSASVSGRRADRSLYVKDLITYSAESLFDQRYSEGFSRIWSLEVKLQKFMREPGRRAK